MLEKVCDASRKEESNLGSLRKALGHLEQVQTKAYH